LTIISTHIIKANPNLKKSLAGRVFQQPARTGGWNEKRKYGQICEPEATHGIVGPLPNSLAKIVRQHSCDCWVSFSFGESFSAILGVAMAIPGLG
jgi:hypothetical protein